MNKLYYYIPRKIISASQRDVSAYYVMRLYPITEIETQTGKQKLLQNALLIKLQRIRRMKKKVKIEIAAEKLLHQTFYVYCFL